MADSRVLEPVRRLGNLLSNSSTFQSCVGLSSAALALAKILWPEANDRDPAHERPRAILRNADGHQMYMPPSGNDHDGGVLELTLELVVPEGTNRASPKSEYEWICNAVGDVLEEMRAYKDANPGTTILYPLHFVCVAEPQRLDEDDVGTFAWGCLYLVFWGIVSP
jgi:hypothetical protein